MPGFMTKSVGSSRRTMHRVQRSTALLSDFGGSSTASSIRSTSSLDSTGSKLTRNKSSESSFQQPPKEPKDTWGYFVDVKDELW